MLATRLSIVLALSFVTAGGCTTVSNLDAARPVASAAVSDGLVFERRVPSPEAVPAAAALEPEKPAVVNRRQMIYAGDIRLTAFAADAAIDQVRALAESMGGFLTSREGSSVTVRVPATSFDALVGKVKQLGKVVSESVKASDVTEELFDLQTRIDNATKTRERLLDHLSKSAKMEDTLKIEEALARVSEELERMKGRQKFLADQVAFSTLRVTVNSPMPQQENQQQQIPFSWVRELGAGLVSGEVANFPQKGGFFDKGARFDLPPGYIRYYDTEQMTQVMSADGMFMKLQKLDNYDEGDLLFWSKLARRVLSEQRAVNIEAESEAAVAGGTKAVVLRGTREIGASDKRGYQLAIVRTKKNVFALEMWGPLDTFNRDRAALDKAITTLRVN